MNAAQAPLCRACIVQTPLCILIDNAAQTPLCKAYIIQTPLCILIDGQTPLCHHSSCMTHSTSNVYLNDFAYRKASTSKPLFIPIQSYYTQTFHKENLSNLLQIYYNRMNRTSPSSLSESNEVVPLGRPFLRQLECNGLQKAQCSVTNRAPNYYLSFNLATQIAQKSTANSLTSNSSTCRDRFGMVTLPYAHIISRPDSQPSRSNLIIRD